MYIMYYIIVMWYILRKLLLPPCRFHCIISSGKRKCGINSKRIYNIPLGRDANVILPVEEYRL